MTESVLPILPPPADRRSIREAAGIGVRAMARLLNVPPTTVLRWESGESNPRPKNVEAYAILLERVRRQAPKGLPPDDPWVLIVEHVNGVGAWGPFPDLDEAIAGMKVLEEIGIVMNKTRTIRLRQLPWPE